MAAVVLLAAGGWAWFAGLPKLANHYGFALPRPGGLPFRVAYAGRDYENIATCAGATWCRQAPPDSSTCWSAARAQARALLPAPGAGSVMTLFGRPHALLARPVVDGLVPTGVLVTDGPACYVPYALEGGP
ncbi:MAG TPA: hypothetical protein VFN57_03100 [Thermomicrobiaceae bacterium]|nr:hypothetical protein [Thermomicrobiaceae bacterium]